MDRLQASCWWKSPYFFWQAHGTQRNTKCLCVHQANANCSSLFRRLRRYLTLWAPRIVTDVKAWQGPLLTEPTTNDLAKVCLLLPLFAMTRHTRNMLFHSFSAQTDRRVYIPLYVLFITSAKYFNLEIRHWWNLYYIRMLGQDLLPTEHAAL